MINTVFNAAEACLWFLIALIVFRQVLKQGRNGVYFNILMPAGISFLAFGISDIIEVQTGAWWRPVGLLLLKALCLLTFFGCFIAYRRVKRKGSASPR